MSNVNDVRRLVDLHFDRVWLSFSYGIFVSLGIE